MWRVARRYGLALAATGIALTANKFLEPLLNEHLFILLLGAVFVSGWYGGLGPGLVSTICSVLGIEFFFLSPVNSLRVENPADAVRLVLFAVVALGVTALNHRLRSAEERARALARTEQETRLRAEEATRDLEGELAERRRVERQQAIQFAVTRILTEAESLESAAPALLRVIGEGLPASFAAAWQMSPRSDALQCFAVWNAPGHEARVFEEETRRRLLAPGVGLPGRVWGTGRQAGIPDLTRETDFLRASAAAADGLRMACAFPVLRRGRSVAVFEFFSPEAQEAREGVLSSLEDMGQRIGQFVERRQAFQRLRILSEASSVLGTSLEYEATLASVARLAVPALADACVIDVVQQDGSLRRLAPVLDDPWREKLQGVFRGERLDPRKFNPVLEVVQTGKPEFLPDVSDSLLRVLVPGNEEFVAMKRRGPRSASASRSPRGERSSVRSRWPRSTPRATTAPTRWRSPRSWPAAAPSRWTTRASFGRRRRRARPRRAFWPPSATTCVPPRTPSCCSPRSSGGKPRGSGAPGARRSWSGVAGWRLPPARSRTS